MEDKRSGSKTLYEAVTVVSMLCSFGLPGKYERLSGSLFVALVNYLPFFLQIAAMLGSSGKDLQDIKLVKLKKKYLSVYLMVGTFFIGSMLVTRYPVEQFISCFRFSVTALYALWMLDYFTVEEILEMACVAQMIFLALTALYFLAAPGDSFSMENGERSFTGLFTTKNPCGTELSFVLALMAALYKIKKLAGKAIPVYFAPLFVTHVILMAACKAMGAVFCGLLPTVYILFFEKADNEKTRLPLGYLYVIGSVGFIIFALTILPVFEPVLTAMGKDATLTGRTPMWEQFVSVMMENRTLVGFGFCMFWKDPQAYGLWHAKFRAGTWGNTMTFGAHNTIFELWLDDGLIGIAAYFFMLLSSMRNIPWMDEPEYLMCSTFMIWETLKGLTERSYIPFNYQTLFLFLSVGAACSGQARRLLSNPGSREAGRRRTIGKI